MNRLTKEKNYWNKASKDPKVDIKYISDIGKAPFLDLLGKELKKGKTLEIGCGVGRLMQDGYCGIDISEGMLEIAKKRKPKCHFKLSDGRSIPYKDETFDSVYCVLVFQHIPFDAVQFYIDEASRVLKKDGVFIFQMIHGDEDEPFSKHHRVGKLNIAKFSKDRALHGLIHPQWTWIKLTK